MLKTQVGECKKDRAAGESRPERQASEVQLQGKLEDPGIECIRDLAKGRCVDILWQRRAGDEEVSVVENVEYFPTKFNIHVFIDPRPLDQSQIEVPVTWSSDGSQLQTSNRSCCWITQQVKPVGYEIGIKHQWCPRVWIKEQSGVTLEFIDAQVGVDGVQS